MTLDISHIEEPSKCHRGCGALLIRIEGISEHTGGTMRISCEAVADIETGAIRLKIHNECRTQENDS